MSPPLHALLVFVVAFVNNGALSSPQMPDKAPPNLRAVPSTSFTCEGRPAGYYADPEAQCQAYHMCDTLEQQYSYLCPGYTLFNQKFMVCDHWHAVNCSIADQYYELNKMIGQVPEKNLLREENNMIQRKGKTTNINKLMSVFQITKPKNSLTASLKPTTNRPNRFQTTKRPSKPTTVRNKFPTTRRTTPKSTFRNKFQTTQRTTPKPTFRSKFQTTRRTTLKPTFISKFQTTRRTTPKPKFRSKFQTTRRTTLKPTFRSKFQTTRRTTLKPKFRSKFQTTRRTTPKPTFRSKFQTTRRTTPKPTFRSKFQTTQRTTPKPTFRSKFQTTRRTTPKPTFINKIQTTRRPISIPTTQKIKTSISRNKFPAFTPTRSPPTTQSSPLPTTATPSSFPLKTTFTLNSVRNESKSLSINARGSGLKIKFGQDNSEEHEKVIKGIKFRLLLKKPKRTFFDKENFTIPPQVLASTPASVVKKKNVIIPRGRLLEIKELIPFLVPPLVESPSQPPNISNFNFLSPFLVPPPKAPVILHGENQEILTPLVVSRIQPPAPGRVSAPLPHPQITRPRFPFSRSNSDFFIPAPGLLPPLPDNSISEEDPRVSAEHDTRHHHHRMTMTFPTNSTVRRRRPFRINPNCPRCHPAFLRPNECQPCVIIK